MKIGYVRVSTDEQTPALQLDALHSAGCELIFEDHGISGACRARPALDKLLEQISTGDVLMVWKLDRLGRSLAYLIKLIDILREKGAGFCSLTDGIDTTTSTGKLVFHIMGALAEFERDLISERTRAGMKAAKARGVKIGRPRKLSSDQIQEAYLLAEHGMTFTAIGRRYQVDRSTVSRAVHGYR